MKKVMRWVMAATMICGIATVTLTACTKAQTQKDNPAQQVE